MTGLTMAEMTPGRPFGREIEVTEARLIDMSDEGGVRVSSGTAEVSASSGVVTATDVVAVTGVTAVTGIVAATGVIAETSSCEGIADEVSSLVLPSHSGEVGGVSAKNGVVPVAA